MTRHMAGYDVMALPLLIHLQKDPNRPNLVHQSHVDNGTEGSYNKAHGGGCLVAMDVELQ